MVIETVVVIAGGLLTGLLFGVAFSQHRYMKGFHKGYHEALEYVDNQTILVVDETGNINPLSREELEELTRKNT